MSLPVPSKRGNTSFAAHVGKVEFYNNRHANLQRLVTCSIPRGLSEALLSLKQTQFISFPEHDARKFANFLDSEMGFK